MKKRTGHAGPPLQRGTTAVAKWHVFMGFGQMEHLPRAELQLSRQEQLVDGGEEWREVLGRQEKCWEEKGSVVNRTGSVGKGKTVL